MTTWFVIGISGVSCAGKSTLAQNLQDVLNDFRNVKNGGKFPAHAENLKNLQFEIGTVDVIHQDNYFLPENHSQNKRIEVLNQVNWELITSMDMKRMCSDIEHILSRNLDFNSPQYVDVIMEQEPPETMVNFLIIEGFSIFEDSFVDELSNMKFHLHLPYEKSYSRRKVRVYPIPDAVGYFEMCVWPAYEKYFRDRIKDRKDVRLLNADVSKEQLFKFVLNTICSILEKRVNDC